ncbi:hypothetical protein SA58113_2404 [Staphylococcus argenteus]|nr:hypothetical protein SA58113_2404 [Staphylococcus argenteus]
MGEVLSNIKLATKNGSDAMNFDFLKNFTKYRKSICS